MGVVQSALRSLFPYDREQMEDTEQDVRRRGRNHRRDQMINNTILHGRAENDVRDIIESIVSDYKLDIDSDMLEIQRLQSELFIIKKDVARFECSLRERDLQYRRNRVSLQGTVTSLTKKYTNTAKESNLHSYSSYPVGCTNMPVHRT